MLTKNLPYEESRDNLIRHFLHYQNFALRRFSLYRSHTGSTGAEYINSLKPKAVLDVGCAANNFKGVINNLTGIDLIHYPTIAAIHRIYRPAAAPDIVGDVLDHYKNLKNKFDIIFCVGALNNGDENHICKMLELFKDLVGSGGRIFGHVRPGQVSDLERNERVGFLHYPWTFKEAHRIASIMNLEVVTLEIEHSQIWRMPDDMIVMYRELFNNRKIWSPPDGGNLTPIELDDWKKFKVIHKLEKDAIDPNIKSPTNFQQHAAINNEYNRRFNPDKYVKDHPDMGMRYKLHWELVVK